MNATLEISKHISSTAVELARSRIALAGYNPRRISDGARKLLRANIKRLGVMGGIVWNARTGCLVGGHQKVAILDGLHGYDPATNKNDYLLRAERVDLSPKEEREQNIFLNNRNAQGEFDGLLLRDVISDIDPALAGLDAFDLELAGAPAAEPALGDALPEIPPLGADGASPEDRKSAIMEKKSAAREKAADGAVARETYLTLVFASPAAKAAFMGRFGLDPMENVIAGEEFGGMIEDAP